MTLEASGVWYSYQPRRWALRGASLRLEPGELVAVMGPNGAGKTTLLKVAGGLYKPARGRVSVDGLDPWGPRGLEARRRVVYVHEDPVMLRGTVLDNIAYPLRLRGLPRGEALEQAARAAEEVGVAHLLDRDARGLSAGQAQLVAVARALAARPTYLLLDEPFASLDPPTRSRLASLLQHLTSQGMGVAVATHDTLLASRAADRIIVVTDGATREAGSPSEAYQTSQASHTPREHM